MSYIEWQCYLQIACGAQHSLIGVDVGCDRCGEGSEVWPDEPIIVRTGRHLACVCTRLAGRVCVCCHAAMQCRGTDSGPIHARSSRFQ